MSLITEKKRKELSSKTVKQLAEEGYKLPEHLKAALEERIFYKLAEHRSTEVYTELGLTEESTENYRSALTSNNLVKRFKKKGKEYTNEEYLEAVERLGPCSCKKIMKNLGVDTVTVNRHLEYLEKKKGIKRIRPAIGSSGKKYGQSDFFGELFSSCGYLIFDPKNPDHLMKLTEMFINNIPRQMNRRMKSSLTKHLKNMRLPEEVFRKVIESYLSPRSLAAHENRYK